MTAAHLLGMRSSFVIAALWSATALAGPAAPTRTRPAPRAPAQAAPAPAQTAPTPAQSATTPPVTLIEVDELPEACLEMGKLAGSQSKTQALSARISLASCLADQNSKSLVLCDCEQSVIDVNEAIDPSLALLDEVVLYGDPATRILARYAQGEILSGFAQRMLATVPAPLNASEEAIALRDTRLDILLPLIQPWQERARAAYADVDKIARANPQLAKNPAVLAAVRSTRAKLSQSAQSAKR